MKFSLFILIALFSMNSPAQNLSAEEQRKLVEDMRVMKEKMDKLESKQGSAPSGLKKVNYQDETSEKKTEASPSASGASMTPEQTKKLMEDINSIKAKQAESQKILDELDKEDQ